MSLVSLLCFPIYPFFQKTNKTKKSSEITGTNNWCLQSLLLPSGGADLAASVTPLSPPHAHTHTHTERRARSLIRLLLRAAAAPAVQLWLAKFPASCLQRAGDVLSDPGSRTRCHNIFMEVWLSWKYHSAARSLQKVALALQLSDHSPLHHHTLRGQRSSELHGRSGRTGLWAGGVKDILVRAVQSCNTRPPSNPLLLSECLLYLRVFLLLTRE